MVMVMIVIVHLWQGHSHVYYAARSPPVARWPWVGDDDLIAVCPVAVEMTVERGEGLRTNTSTQSVARNRWVSEALQAMN